LKNTPLDSLVINFRVDAKEKRLVTICSVYVANKTLLRTQNCEIIF